MNNLMLFRLILVVLAALSASGLRSSAMDINATLSQWNVVTSGNLKLVKDLRGNAFIGGNVVGGSANLSRMLNRNNEGIVTQGDNAAPSASPVGAIVDASQYWSTLPANSTTSVTSNGQLGFNCASDASLAVFNVNASQMFGSGYQGFILNPSAATGTVLINVDDTNVNWTTGAFFSQLDTGKWAGRVLFNFHNATSVTLSGLINGYIVAPNAEVTVDHSLDGGVMAKDLTVASGVNLPSRGNTSAWQGLLPNAVAFPAAASICASLGGLVMLIGILFSKKRRCVMRDT